MKKSIIIFGILLGLIALGIAYYGYKLDREFGYSQNNQNDIPTTIITQTTTEKPPTASKTETLEEIKNKTTGCRAAFTPVDENYAKSKNISDQTKKLLGQYRTHWQGLCRGQEGFNLGLLWNEADIVTKLSHEDAQGYPESDLCDRGENGECVPIMAFTPGIEGVYAEGTLQDLVPSQKLFAENIVLGSQEDKDFFTTYNSLNLDNSNSFAPWVEQTWDYGGCTKYGSYDWVETLNKMDTLLKKVTNTGYIEHINSTRDRLLEDVTDNIVDFSSIDSKTEICACGKKEAVLTDLEKVLGYSKDHPFSYTIYGKKQDGAATLNYIIAKIKDKKITVNSEAERHCSGG